MLSSRATEIISSRTKYLVRKNRKRFIHAVIGQKIIETNQILLKAPIRVNDNPYEDSWLIKIEIKDVAELENLQAATQYEELTN